MYHQKHAQMNRFALISMPLLMQACVFGENKQFFEKPISAVSLNLGNIPVPALPGSIPVVGATPSATPAVGASPFAPVIVLPSATPGASPGASPFATATPSPSASPGSSPSASPSATPLATATPRPSATPTPTPCTAATTSENLRIMFMVDNSGSTAYTDPNHNYRTSTVQNFINSYGSHTNLTYSFGYFNGTTAKEYDGARHNFQINSSSPFGNANFLSAALNLYDTFSPSDYTPYTAAFNSMKSIVQHDEAAGNRENYVVVFMSDGMPTDISGNQNSGIINLVDNLRAATQVNGTALLTVSAVYFGPASDHESIGNLQSMASEGKGQFVDTNQLNSALLINDVINVPGSCQSH